MKYLAYMVACVCAVLIVLIIGEQDLRMQSINLKCHQQADEPRQGLRT